ncbi:MAG: cytochrome c-type biogenesis protein CcmH, partial [Proteobacteria bacterium]|nr:cytochrome c-type biogenesis protein CcmH [Pseudomonadota bacterium]
MKLALAFIFILLISNIAISYAFAPEEQLPAAQEERAKNLFMRVKCLVCDGQVIAASDTEIAYNLR